MSFYFVYVLLSLRDNKFYIGFSSNVERRLLEHQAGKNISTAHRRPLQLIFYEAFVSKEDALRRERYFKTSKGKTVLRMMVSSFLKTDNVGVPAVAVHRSTATGAWRRSSVG